LGSGKNGASEFACLCPKLLEGECDHEHPDGENGRKEGGAFVQEVFSEQRSKSEEERRSKVLMGRIFPEKAVYLH